MGAVSSVAAAAGASSRTVLGKRSVARPAQITAATAATDSHAPTDCTAQGSPSMTQSAASATSPRGATTRWRSFATSSATSIAAERAAGAGKPSTQTYMSMTTVPATKRARGPSRSRMRSTFSHAAKNPTCSPEIERRCASPERV